MSLQNRILNHIKKTLISKYANELKRTCDLDAQICDSELLKMLTFIRDPNGILNKTTKNSDLNLVRFPTVIRYCISK